MQFRLTNSQRYLVNAKPGTNHSTNPTNPNGNSGNPKSLTLLNVLRPTLSAFCDGTPVRRTGKSDDWITIFLLA